MKLKNKKKGFTLIELLAVIAILAILVIIAVPTILQLFQEAKKNTFVTQAQSIFKAAENTFMKDQIIGGGGSVTYCYDGPTTANDNPLELTGSSSVYYLVIFNSNGMTEFKVKDSTWGINIISNPTIDGITASASVAASGVTISCPVQP